MKAELDLNELKNLIASCGKGIPQAREEFQALYGKIIYSFPVKVFRIDEERAADFYLYVFEKDRIFKRLKGFRGDRISLRNYLNYFVLKNLAFEWLRKESSAFIDTIPFDDNASEAVEKHQYGGERNPVEMLEKGDWLVLRILYMYVLQLTPEDIEVIIKKSGKSKENVDNLMKRVENRLDLRAARKIEQDDHLETLFSRRLEYHRRLVIIEEDILTAKENNDRARLDILKNRKDELLEKYNWRLRQVEVILEKYPLSMVATSYKDIAELLGTTTGAVGAMIYKTKERFRKHFLSAPP